jgi:hypothetical protein
MHINCRRRLNKSNANASRVPGRCQLPVVQGHDAHGFMVGQAFGHNGQNCEHKRTKSAKSSLRLLALGVNSRYAQNPKRFSLVFGECRW